MRSKPARQGDRTGTWGQRLGFAGICVALGLLTVAPPAAAQAVDCQALRAELDGSTGDAARADQFAGALRQRQAELARTRDYADSIGCNSGLPFGEPPQCDAIAARIEQVQETLGQLQEQAQAGGLDNGWRRRALTEQFNSFCRTSPDGGLPVPAENPQVLPGDPDAPPPDDQPPTGPSAPPQQTKALCVRHCDGGFFPITDQATPDKLEGLGQLCKALCPNAEASLYTTAPSGGIETAVAADGTPYTALPAAFRYQKTYDATCSCKPPHQSWVQALAAAEKLLEPDKSDVVVTEKMSASMSRPAAAPAPKPGAKRTRESKAARKAKSKAAAATPDLAAEAPPSAENPGEDVMRQLRRAEPTL